MPSCRNCGWIVDEWGLSQYGCCPDCGAGGDGREDISLAPTEEGNHWEESESEDDGGRPGPIHDAAIECDVEELRHELGRGVSANQRIPGNGKTPLHWLCSSDKADWAIGGAECFHVLLAAGADINAACDIFGETPLSEAACRVHPSLQLLLEAGADVNLRPPDQLEGGPWNLTALENVIMCRGYGARRRRAYPILLRAGSELPTAQFMQAERDRLTNANPPVVFNEPYIENVIAAGSLANYERLHRAKLTNMFASKFDFLPKEVVQRVVEFWSHAGDY